MEVHAVGRQRTMHMEWMTASEAPRTDLESLSNSAQEKKGNVGK